MALDLFGPLNCPTRFSTYSSSSSSFLRGFSGEGVEFSCYRTSPQSPLLRRIGVRRRDYAAVAMADSVEDADRPVSSFQSWSVTKVYCTPHYQSANSAVRRSSMAQWKIPCLFMRGGTSRGPYFLRQHLPTEKETLDKLLLKVMGSPDAKQIDGIGGAVSVTSKVAIIKVSENQEVSDVDYTFAQVNLTKPFVDWEPSCGNMLAGIGPAAIEMGLIKNVTSPVTKVRINATNNGALVEAVIQVDEEKNVKYDGDASIDGVPGTASPVTLNFMNIVGSKSGGKLLPTGKIIDTINGVEVTCIDVAMPIVIARAESFGKTGYESKSELDADKDFFEKIEAIRRIAGEKMGLGDVSNRVIPKFAILAKPKDSENHNISARYFVPDSTHGAMAVTGAICIGCCSILKGSVAEGLAVETREGPTTNKVIIEHPSGKIQIIIDSEQSEHNLTVKTAGVLRTCRLLYEGNVCISQKDMGHHSYSQSSSHLKEFLAYHERLGREFRHLYKFAEPESFTSATWSGPEESSKIIQ